jgi:beta-N-acetylhexosaminidase
MSRSTFTLLALLTALAGLLGYNYFARPFSQNMQQQVISSPSPSAENTSEPKFDSLSSKQRVALIIAAPLLVTETGQNSDHLEWIQEHSPGAITLFGENVSSTSAHKAIEQVLKNYSTDPLLAVDHEGGTVQRFSGEGFTILPSWQSMCSMSSTERKALLSVSASELQALGIDVVYGPVIDIAASGSALKTRACGSDAQYVASRAIEYLEVFSEKSILPVVKHFPGIGSVTRDLHEYPATITASEQELTAYEYVLGEYPQVGAMMAHVSVDGGLGGEVCSLSKDCVKGFKTLFNQALVFSDALEMKSAAIDPTASSSATLRPLTDRAVRAALAGNHLLLFGPDVTSEELDLVINELIKQYEQDILMKRTIDESAREVFEFRQEL